MPKGRHLKASLATGLLVAAAFFCWEVYYQVDCSVQVAEWCHYTVNLLGDLANTLCMTQA